MAELEEAFFEQAALLFVQAALVAPLLGDMLTNLPDLLQYSTS